MIVRGTLAKVAPLRSQAAWGISASRRVWRGFNYAGRGRAGSVNRGPEDHRLYATSSDQAAVEVSPSGHGTKPLPDSYAELHHLDSRLRKNLQKASIASPTPVQRYCIPLLAAGHDAMVCAQTGSGKTLMFLLPGLHELLRSGANQPASRPGPQGPLQPSMLVLAPTRELATQIHEAAAVMTNATPLKAALAYGGTEVGAQLRSMRRGCNMLVATPGRLQMFLDRRQISLKGVQVLVVDEADRMLDMGFEPQLRSIMRALPPPARRTSCMCSATFPQDIQRMASEFLRDPYYFVTVGRVGSTTDLITQDVRWVEDNQRQRELGRVLRDSASGSMLRTLVFVNQKASAQEVSRALKQNGFKNRQIHGDLTQNEREAALSEFRKGKIPILVATDVAARGLDIQGVDHVIQYEAATDVDTFVHRIGRTGRAGRSGLATSFLNSRHKSISADLVKMLDECGQAVPSWLQGMANLASQESADLASVSLEAADSGSGEFGAQDFRKTAQQGTWGAAQKLSFDGFEANAYGSGDTSAEASLKAKQRASDKSRASAVFADSSEKVSEDMAANFVRPDPTPALVDALVGIQGDSLIGDSPSEKVLQRLGKADRALYFEYLAMFPAGQFVQTKSKYRQYLDSLPKVLMVAEKPSIAEAMAHALSPKNKPRPRRGIGRASPVFEFAATYPETGEMSCIRITSVVGHIFGLQFRDDATETPGSAAGRGRKDPGAVFGWPAVKVVEESSNKLRVVEHLRNEAEGAQSLVLWLDCDNEGENIAHEVISVTRESFPSDSQIRRARFSSIAPNEIRSAYQNLNSPDAKVSMAVDARQELDLKVGVAFTRWLTRNYRGLAGSKFERGISPISYGPCQTPTLYFCVERMWEIANFERQDFWEITATAKYPGTSQAGGMASLNLRWAEDRTFQEDQAEQIKSGANGQTLTVTKLELKNITQKRPNGLNTVGMLVACSKALGISPKKTMQVAEKLYSSGYISYPRTETTRYAESMDLRAALSQHKSHPAWGNAAKYLLKKGVKVPAQGKSVGDHDPIYPIKAASRAQLPNTLEWRVYEFVARHFLGSLSSDLKYTECTYQLETERGVRFCFSEVVLNSLGFAGTMSWVRRDVFNRPGVTEVEKPSLCEGDELNITEVRVEKGTTRPPPFLQEHELVSRMDEHGVGTDASMSTHVENVVARKYVLVCDELGVPIRPYNPKAKKKQERQVGRYMVPTPLGVGLIEGFRKVDEELVLPSIRSMMEKEVAQIAAGSLDKEEVLGKNLEWFRHRFDRFTNEESKMTAVMQQRLKPTSAFLKELRRMGAFKDQPQPETGRGRTAQRRRSTANVQMQRKMASKKRSDARQSRNSSKATSRANKQKLTNQDGGKRRSQARKAPVG